MKAKASVLTLRIPNELKHKIEKVADQQGVSINQLAMYAFTKEIQEMETYNQFSKYWKNKSKKDLFSDFSEKKKALSFFIRKIFRFVLSIAFVEITCINAFHTESSIIYSIC
jgi:hypothetical protein